MKQHIHLFAIYVLLTFPLWGIEGAHAQTNVNKEWKTDAGIPASVDWQASATHANGNTVTVGNRQNGATSDLYISLTHKDGTLLWENTIDVYNDHDYGSAVAFLGNDIVVGGATFNPSENAHDMIIARFSETGNLLWNVIYAGNFAGNDAVTSVAVSNIGNIFITGGSEGNGTLYDYHTMKLNGSGTILWHATYDHGGLFDIPAAITVDAQENTVVTGGSSATFTNWEYATVKYDASGNQTGEHRLQATGAGVDRPEAMKRTTDGNIHITGTASDDGTNYDIRTIKLSPTLNLEWTATYANPGLQDKATGIDVDSDGNTYVSGTITNTDGTETMITIAYDPNGTELWVKKRQPQDSEGGTKGKDIKVTPDDKLVIVGEETKDGNTDILTIQYDLEGTKKWEKKIDGGNNATDKAAKVTVDATGDIYITGKTSDGVTEKYTTVKYSTFTKPKVVVMDSAGTQPLYLDNTFIVKFAPSAMIVDNINALEKTYGKPEFFLKADKLQQLEDSLGFSLKDFIFIRMFKHLRTTDTISISRLGEEIPIPKFWSAFMLVTPQGWDTPTTINTFNAAYPVVHYAEYNRIIQAWSGCEVVEGEALAPANDNLYGAQKSLDPLVADEDYIDPLDQVGINIEPAWCMETGKPFIRVGIMDSGLDYEHEDLATNLPDANGNLVQGNVVEGVWDFFSNSLMTTDLDPFGHGTKVAGIIGAVRNNNTGIAGIAGGDEEAGQQGITLQGYRILGPIEGEIIENQYGVSDMSYVVDAIYRASTDIFLQSIEYPFQKPAHVLNHSWGIIEGSAAWPSDTNGTLPINVRILEDVMHYSSRNKVINVVARGNATFSPYDIISFPACYEDSWVINVGGTGENGAYKYKANGGSNAWTALTGPLVDIAAPFSRGMIETIGTDNDYIHDFGMTSASTPHVSGTAALMLSYWNEDVSVNSNLAPEDVEFLMENSATDAMIPDIAPWQTHFDEFSPLYNIEGPDEFIGHGRLNAGKAMSYLDRDRFDLRHYEMIGGTMLTPIQTIGDVHVAQGVTNHEGIPLNQNIAFTVEVYKYESSSVFDLLNTELLPTEQIATLGIQPYETEGIWPRHSSSTLVGQLTPNLVLRDAEHITYNSTSGKWSGIAYHLFNNGFDHGWVPFDPTSPGLPIQFAFSVLVEDLTVGIQEEVEMEMIKLFPNPSTGQFQLLLPKTIQEPVSVIVSDNQGRQLFHKTSVVTGEIIDMRFAPAGVYIVQVNYDDRNIYLKYLKN